MRKKILNKDLKLFSKVGYFQNELKSLIEADKEKYYSRISKKMMNPLTSTKMYWSILKSFLNKKRFPASCPCFIKIGILLTQGSN